MIQFWMKVHVSKSSKIGCFLLDDSEHACNHPKLDVLYNQLLDGSEHAHLLGN